MIPVAVFLAWLAVPAVIAAYLVQAGWRRLRRRP